MSFIIHKSFQVHLVGLHTEHRITWRWRSLYLGHQPQVQAGEERENHIILSLSEI